MQPSFQLRHMLQILLVYSFVQSSRNLEIFLSICQLNGLFVIIMWSVELIDLGNFYLSNSCSPVPKVLTVYSSYCGANLVLVILRKEHTGGLKTSQCQCVCFGINLDSRVVQVID